MKQLERGWKKIKGKRDQSPITVPHIQQASSPHASLSVSQILSTHKDLWQIAYKKLSDEDQKALSGTDNSNLRTIVDDVIQTTENQYNEYKSKGWKIQLGSSQHEIDLRAGMQKILDSTLSFKDLISAVVAADSTGIAASAWALISLGLTTAGNYADLRSALFESSEFLADVLGRCAFIEKHFYHDSKSEAKDELENAIVRVYSGILRLIAEVHRFQQDGAGKKILDSTTGPKNHPLTKIKPSIKDDEQKLHLWVNMDQHLRHQKEAEDRLNKIEKSMEDLNRKFDLSRLPNAEGAAFDSYIDQYEDVCLPGTREEPLREIFEWGNSAQDKWIFWLKGMAGTGKSTISRTVATHFEQNGHLGASFFFKKGEDDRGDAKKLFPTLIKQLIHRIPQLASTVSKTLEDDPDIATKPLDKQFEKLLFEPLKLGEGQNLTDIVIVIDALDECDERDMQIVLRLLPRLKELSSMHLKIFLTSRLQRPIERAFKHITDKDYRHLVLHEVTEMEIKNDISLFLKYKLSKVKEESEDDYSFPPGWPSNESVQILTERAVPLFIYASTMCRLIGDPKWNPKRRLERLLADRTKYASKMDSTYLPILNQLTLEQDASESKAAIQIFKDVVGVIILLSTPLSINALSHLIGLDADDMMPQLNLLCSVLYIPKSRDVPVRLFHLSFRDYVLEAKTKAQDAFWINEQETHQKITAHCLAVMSNELKEDICELKAYGMRRLEIDADSIKQHLSPELQYSCRYWMWHLEQCSQPKAQIDNVFSFIQAHFLHWMEAMAILGFAFETVEVIVKLQSFTEDKEISEFLHDARRFILKNRQMANIAPLQLYASGLVFAPMKSLVRKQFSTKIPGWICGLPKVDDTWNEELETIEAHYDLINTVVFSPDSQLLASASEDETVRIWSSTTGALQHILEGHSDGVHAAVFSPDGKQLASASRDRTIRLWDTTGALQCILEGHSNEVWSVAFSSTGQLLASASEDNTVRLWNLVTDTPSLKSVLEGHSDLVHCVAFSPNSQLLASASYDKTVRLWDPANGSLQQTIGAEYNHKIISVTFSPDGQLLAFDLESDFLILWDLATGSQRHKLDGYHDSFYSDLMVQTVDFSPDGRLLAHASGTKGVIELWSTVTGVLLHTIVGHNRYVSSVAFSSDSKLLCSASMDGTFQIWDSMIGISQQNCPEQHSEDDIFVLFSPDSKLLASSCSNIIKFWSSPTGAMKHTLEGHLSPVSFIGFSPDSQLLLSVSVDNTAMVWDHNMGILKHTLVDFTCQESWYWRDVEHTISFSPDSQLVATLSIGNSIKLWDRATNMKRVLGDEPASNIAYKQDKRPNGFILFSPDGRSLVSTARKNVINLWDPVTDTLQHILEGHADRVECMAFSSNSELLASGSKDKTIRLWDLVKGTLQHILREPRGKRFNALAFSPDSQLIASATFRDVHLWDYVTRTVKHSFDSRGYITELAFSETGPYLESNVGSFDIRPFYGKSDPAQAQSKTDVRVLDKERIAIRGKVVLWLPPTYRSQQFAVRDGILAIVLTSGQVKFLRFC